MKNPSASIPAIAILAGGQSRRMGTDKVLLPLVGIPMIEHVVRAAAPLTQNLFIVGHSEIPNWPATLPITFLPDPPSRDRPGPTVAIIHILQTTQAATLLLGCDMPLLTTATLATLWQFHQGQTPPPIATLTLSSQDPKRAEPLLAIYTPAAIPALMQLLQNNDRLQLLLQNPGTAQFLAPSNLLHEITNINDPAALAQAETLLAART